MSNEISSNRDGSGDNGTMKDDTASNQHQHQNDDDGDDDDRNHDHRDGNNDKREDNSDTTMIHEDDTSKTMKVIIQDLSRRQPIPSNPEDPLDPIEWTVRQLIPIPATYYWEYTPDGRERNKDQNEDTANAINTNTKNSNTSTSSGDTTTTTTFTTTWQARLPWQLKTWHRLIGWAEAGLHWTDRWVAQPVASATGLTESRWSYVTDHMTRDDWRAAAAVQRQRRQRYTLQDSETGQGLVLVHASTGALVVDDKKDHPHPHPHSSTPHSPQVILDEER